MELRKDGKFDLHMENHVMVNFVEDADGTFTVAGDHVKLSGKAKTFFDDGYKQSTEDSSYSQTFFLKKGLLWGSFGSADGKAPKLEFVFFRPGEKLNIPRGDVPFDMKPSDPRAVDFVHRMEATYASLKGYFDQGTLKSAGANGNTSTRFETRYRGSGQFYFRSSPTGKGRESRVWTAGNHTMLHKENHDKSVASITQGFVEISQDSGGAGFLVAGLLMPRLMQSNQISDMREILWKGTQIWDGKKYVVIQTSNLPGQTMEFWIEPSTFLIERIHQSDEAEPSLLDIVIHPHAD